MSKTDQFDMVVQISEASLRRVLQTQHALGVFDRDFSEVLNDRRVDLVINCPQFTAGPISATIPADGSQHAVLATRVFYNSRSALTQADLGQAAVADVNTQCVIRLSSGNPTLLDSTRLVIDWTSTNNADLAVHADSSATDLEARKALLTFLREHGINTFDIPAIGPADERIGFLGFRFAEQNSKRVLSVGMNVGPANRGNPQNLTTIFVQRDWSLALSSTYFLHRLRAELAAQLPLPFRVFKGCTVSTLFGCAVRTTVTLVDLDVELENGFISVEGDLDIVNTHAPDAGATFTAEILLKVTSSGQVVPAIQNVQTDVDGLVAEVVNFVSGGMFTNKIAAAVRRSLQSSEIGGTGFFDARVLNSIAKGHVEQDLAMTPLAKTAAIARDGVILHGDLETPSAENNPEPVFATIGIPSNGIKHRILFHAQQSSAPGSQIARYAWEFSDGQSETWSDTHARFLTIHEYSALNPLIPNRPDCLTITDVKGRIAKWCAYTPVIPVVVPCAPGTVAATGATAPQVPRAPIAAEFINTAHLKATRPVLFHQIEALARQTERSFFSPSSRRSLQQTHDFGLTVNPVPSLDVLVGTKGAYQREFELIYPDSRLDTYIVSLCVVETGNPLAGIQVRLSSTAGLSSSGTTDKNGRVLFQLKPSDLGLDADRSVPLVARMMLQAAIVERSAQTVPLKLWTTTAKDREALLDGLRDRLWKLRSAVVESQTTRTLMSTEQAPSQHVPEELATAVRGIQLLRNIYFLILHGSAEPLLRRVLSVEDNPDAGVQLSREIEQAIKTVETAVSKWVRDGKR